MGKGELVAGEVVGNKEYGSRTEVMGKAEWEREQRQQGVGEYGGRAEVMGKAEWEKAGLENWGNIAGKQNEDSGEWRDTNRQAEVLWRRNGKDGRRSMELGMGNMADKQK